MTKATPIPLSLDTLRALGGWTAGCAERALPLYMAHPAADGRPQAAIDGIRAFAAGGPRTAALRTLYAAANAAARAVGDPAVSPAAAAARAAALAASSAYTHPLAAAEQTKHILAPPAYAILALTLAHDGDPAVFERELRWVLDQAPAPVRDLLRLMPARTPGKSRIDRIMALVDAGLRG